MGHFIALSSIVGWRENTRTCHVRAYKQGVSMNGSCLLNRSVSQITHTPLPPNSTCINIFSGENNIAGLFQECSGKSNVQKQTDGPTYPLAAALWMGVAPCTLFTPKSAP